MNTIKSRNWSAVIWEDRASLEWQSTLEELCLNRGMKAAISPIHDRDVWTKHDEKINPAHIAGTLKPAHYHVLITNPAGSVTEKTMERLLEPFDPQLMKISMNDGGLGSMYDYLTHKHNPDKARYYEDEIILINGFDPLSIRSQTKMEKVEIRKKIRDIITSENFINMIDLERYLENKSMYIELSYIESNTYKVQSLLMANRDLIERKRDDDFKNSYR